MKKRTIIITASISVALLALIAILTPIVFSTLMPNFFEARNEQAHTAPRRDAETSYTIAPPATATIIDEAFAIAPTALGQITITALSTSNLGIARDSSFSIASNTNALTEDHLLRYLSVEGSNGNEDFQLERQANGDFLLHFQEYLTPAQIYRLVYSPTGMQATSHAFQTVDIFRVTATTPANNTHNIPTDTGIEITFSQELANEGDFRDAFVIYPPVEGRFIRRGNTYIFAPSSLEYNTVYHITIRQGLAGVTGDVLEEDYTFSFTSRWGTAMDQAFSIAGSEYETFLPWTEIFIDIRIADTTAFPHRDFIVNLYDMQTPENFIDFYRPGVLIDTFELELITFPSAQHLHYLFLGRTLPIGYYLVTVRSSDRNTVELQKFIQVSAISVYSLSIAGETVFWVHDATTHQPAAGARINIGNNTVTADSNGVAIAETSQNNSELITIEYGNFLPFVYTKLTFAPPDNLLPNGRFLTYMYTDRPTHRPNDTVDIFGVIKPRYGHAHLPNDVFTLRFGDMYEFPISLDAFNAFNMRIPVTGMFGHLDVIVEVNGERLMSTWLDFMDYTNMEFILSGTVDRNAYFHGEYSEIEISVTNFAGTPMQGINLQNRSWDETARRDSTIVTNAYGIAQERVMIGNLNPEHYRHGWYPFRTFHSFSVTSGARISQNINLPFIAAPRDIMLETEFIGDDAISLTSSMITIDRLNAADSLDGLLDNHDIFRCERVDIDFTVEVTRHVVTRTLRDQHYDHINRRTINIYDFDRTEYLYQTIQGRTQNGHAVIENLPHSDDPLIDYQIAIRYYDSRGLGTLITMWRYTRIWDIMYGSNSTIRHFGFQIESRVTDPNTGWWDIRHRDLGVNETTNVILMEDNIAWDPWNPWRSGNEHAENPATGRVLAIIVRDGILSTSVGSPTGTPITFPEAAISSALLFGAYFDGGYIFPIQNPITIHYDYTERDLQIDFTFDRESYSPGDEVTVEIRTADAQGNPVSSRVTVSVVDESSIMRGWDGGDHQANFLSRLYRSSQIERWGFPFTQFASHIQHNFGGAGGGAEGGGGGDGGLEGAFRDWFVDNPVFEVVQTNANGVGTLTFTLPDQITSWRVTALGITSEGLAGDSRYNIISNLPFSVDLMLTNEYIIGDDIVAVARVIGESLIGHSEVEFAFEVLRDDGRWDIVAMDTMTASRQAEFNAGKLAEGSYVMRVVATVGTYRDAVELPFTIVETGIIMPTRTIQQMCPNDFRFDRPSMRPLPVRVTLSNGNIRQLANIMHGALSGSRYRTDIMAATAFVEHFHGWHVGDYDLYDFAANVRSRVHLSNGGIPELTFAYADLDYSARFVTAFPEFVNNAHIIRYVNDEMLSNTDARGRAAGLLALAAVGEPVLLQTQEEIRRLGVVAECSIQHMAMLYLVSALIALGDDVSAYNLLQQHEAFSRTLSPEMRERMDTAMLFINTTLNPQAAWDYLSQDRRNVYVSDVPERINFVRRAIFLEENVSEMQIESFLHNDLDVVRLENFERKTMHLTAEQFQNLNLTPVSGVTDVYIEFYGNDSQNWDDSDRRIEISRNITRVGELYRIDFHVTLPPGETGLFTINDRLPSNMRFVPIRSSHDAGWARNTQRQLVDVSFFQGVNHGRTRTISYHAMKLFEGDMADDITYISNQNPRNHIWGSTN